MEGERNEESRRLWGRPGGPRPRALSVGSWIRGHGRQSYSAQGGGDRRWPSQWHPDGVRHHCRARAPWGDHRRPRRGGEPAAVAIPPAGGSDVPRTGQAHGDDVVRQGRDGGARCRGQIKGRDSLQRARRRPRHRPHDGDEGDRPGAGGRRRDHDLPVLLRRSAGARSQRQPLWLQVLVEPARGVARRPQQCSLPA